MEKSGPRVENATRRSGRGREVIIIAAVILAALLLFLLLRRHSPGIQKVVFGEVASGGATANRPDGTTGDRAVAGGGNSSLGGEANAGAGGTGTGGAVTGLGLGQGSGATAVGGGGGGTVYRSGAGSHKASPDAGDVPDSVPKSALDEKAPSSSGVPGGGIGAIQGSTGAGIGSGGSAGGGPGFGTGGISGSGGRGYGTGGGNGAGVGAGGSGVGAAVGAGGSGAGVAAGGGTGATGSGLGDGGSVAGGGQSGTPSSSAAGGSGSLGLSPASGPGPGATGKGAAGSPGSGAATAGSASAGSPPGSSGQGGSGGPPGGSEAGAGSGSGSPSSGRGSGAGQGGGAGSGSGQGPGVGGTAPQSGRGYGSLGTTGPAKNGFADAPIPVPDDVSKEKTEDLLQMAKNDTPPANPDRDSKSPAIFDPGRGSNVVFVLDRSPAMKQDDRLGAVRRALVGTLEAFDSSKTFYIVFFPDKDMPGSGPLPATPENVHKIADWVSSVGQSSADGPEADPTKAVLRALNFSPDTLWLVSNSPLSAEVAKSVREGNQTPNAEINTVTLYSHESEPVLRQIADENRGRYLFVPAPK